MRSLEIDYRERHVLEELTKRFPDQHYDNRKENLPLGDWIFKEDTEIRYLFERKTVQDLASSIHDGRYKNQKSRIMESFRASQCFFIIEGGLPDYFAPPHHHIHPKALFSSIVNTMTRDGFYVIRTFSLKESCYFLHHMYTQFLEGKDAFANSKEKAAGLAYSSFGQCKKSVHTSADCFQLQLQQIPRISAHTANMIVELCKVETTKEDGSATHHLSMCDFVDLLRSKTDPLSWLRDLPIHKKRKLGPASAESILKHLGISFSPKKKSHV